MYSNLNILNQNFTFYDFEADSVEDLFNKVINKLQDVGYVNNQYLDSLIEREKTFPTGIKMENINIAIPHSESKNVLKNTIVVVKLKNTIVFQNMLDKSDLDVKVVIFLVLNNGKEYINVLSKIMKNLQNINTVNEIIESKNQLDLYKSVSKMQE